MPTTHASRAFWGSIMAILPGAHALIGGDAAMHMLHYLDNVGTTYTIDLEGMVGEVPSARRRYRDEIAQAVAYVLQLPPGTHAFTSRTAEGGYNRQVEGQNWFLAVGGYSSWGRGEARVIDGPSGRRYEIDFEYNFFDRYNWDNGKVATIFGVTITDETMGQLHREGLAREFDMVGSFRRQLRWSGRSMIPESQFVTPVSN